jgi:hypothetical protein
MAYVPHLVFKSIVALVMGALDSTALVVRGSRIGNINPPVE